MAISVTNSILPETASFASKLILNEEKSKSSPDNLPNLTNHLVSNIEEVNYTFTFKESTSQPERLDFVEKMRKEIGAPENDNHWTMVRRRKVYMVIQD